MRGSKTSWTASSWFLRSECKGRPCTSCSRMETEPRLLIWLTLFQLPFYVESPERLWNSIMIIFIVLYLCETQISTFVPQRRQKLLNVGMGHKLRKFIHCQSFFWVGKIQFTHSTYCPRNENSYLLLLVINCQFQPLQLHMVTVLIRRWLRIVIQYDGELLWWTSLGQ
jgi:hypothetical protein